MEAIVQNPFRYGDVATGAFFTDRAAELAELEADIHSAQNVVIISPRRYGKTSLVFQVMERLRPAQVLVAYLDLFRTPTKDRLADHLADSIYAGLVAPLERRRAVDIFRGLPVQPRMTINPDGTSTFEFAPAQRARDVDRAIEVLLALPGQIARQRNPRVALVLDEFQQIVEIDPHLPALMRSVFQAQTEVAHVFLGSRRHLMHRVFTDENEPLYKLAKPLPLRPISAEDFAAFISARFAATGLEITDSAVARIVTITEGHPHDTQELCYFTWSLVREERTAATPELVDRALQRVVEAEDARYTTLWEQLSPHQRLLLIALAREGGDAVYAEAYRRRHRLGAASTVQRSLQRLVERELVEAAPGGDYSMPDAFFCAWILRLTSSNNGAAKLRHQ